MATDALSIDSIKKKMNPNCRLIDYFYKQFGHAKSKSKYFLEFFRI